MILHQYMAGYDRGHYLRTFTTDLDPIDRYVAERLSDLSGYVPVGVSVPPYLTICPLPTSEWYTIQGTWYDDRCERSGCVLSHGLLVPAKDVGLYDLESLASYLRRPESARDTDPYMHALDVHVAPKKQAIFTDDGFDQRGLATSRLWKSRFPAVVEMEEIPARDCLFRSWAYNHWASLGSFAACTFALNFRYVQLVGQRDTEFHLLFTCPEASYSFRGPRGSFYSRDAFETIVSSTVPKPHLHP